MNVRGAPTQGPNAILYDAIRIIRARSGHKIHLYVQNIVNNYATRVYQRTIDELHGHHEERLSPAWNWTRYGVPLILEVPGASRTDSRSLRVSAERHATQLLGRILLREQ